MTPRDVMMESHDNDVEMSDHCENNMQQSTVDVRSLFDKETADQSSPADFQGSPSTSSVDSHDLAHSDHASQYGTSYMYSQSWTDSPSGSIQSASSPRHQTGTKQSSGVKQAKKIKKEDADSRSVNDEELDLDKTLKLDVGRIPVKVLRKVIPRLRVLCYKYDESTNLGKKKFKHLWDEKPHDWPEGIPFKDPNNALKDTATVKDEGGSKWSSQTSEEPSREMGAGGKEIPAHLKKPGKEELRPMFEFLRNKYLELNHQKQQQLSDDSMMTSSITSHANESYVYDTPTDSSNYSFLPSGAANPVHVAHIDNYQMISLDQSPAVMKQQLMHLQQQQQGQQLQHVQQAQQLQQLQQLQRQQYQPRSLTSGVNPVQKFELKVEAISPGTGPDIFPGSDDEIQARQLEQSFRENTIQPNLNGAAQQVVHNAMKQQHQFNRHDSVIVRDLEYECYGDNYPPLGKAQQVTQDQQQASHNQGVPNGNTEVPQALKELYTRLINKQKAVIGLAGINRAQVEKDMKDIMNGVIEKLYKLSQHDTSDAMCRSRLMFLDAGHQMEALLDVMSVLASFDFVLFHNGCQELLNKFKPDIVKMMSQPSVETRLSVNTVLDSALAQRHGLKQGYLSKELDKDKLLELLQFLINDDVDKSKLVNTPLRSNPLEQFTTEGGRQKEELKIMLKKRKSEEKEEIRLVPESSYDRMKGVVTRTKEVEPAVADMIDFRSGPPVYDTVFEDESMKQNKGFQDDDMNVELQRMLVEDYQQLTSFHRSQDMNHLMTSSANQSDHLLQAQGSPFDVHEDQEMYGSPWVDDSVSNVMKYEEPDQTQPTLNTTQLNQPTLNTIQLNQPTLNTIQLNQPTFGPGECTSSSYQPTSIQPTFIAVQPTYTPGQPTFTAVQPTYTPGQPTFTAVQPTYTPGQPTYNPTQPTFTPTQSSYNPSQPTTFNSTISNQSLSTHNPSSFPGCGYEQCSDAIDCGEEEAIQEEDSDERLQDISDYIEEQGNQQPTHQHLPYNQQSANQTLPYNDQSASHNHSYIQQGQMFKRPTQQTHSPLVEGSVPTFSSAPSLEAPPQWGVPSPSSLSNPTSSPIPTFVTEYNIGDMADSDVGPSPTRSRSNRKSSYSKDGSRR